MKELFRQPRTRREMKQRLIFRLIFDSFLLGWWLSAMAFGGLNWFRGVGAGLSLALLIHGRVELGKMVAA